MQFEKNTPMRQLHFSYAETSKHPNPMGDSYKENRSNEMTLNFISYIEAIVNKK